MTIIYIYGCRASGTAAFNIATMPEGPSIVILKEALLPFKGKLVKAVAGYTKADIKRAAGHKIANIRSWGKHLLIEFPGFFVRIHLLMFGSYRINEEKETNPMFRLEFARNQRVNFYTCSVKILDGTADDVYDWSADVMSDSWSAEKAKTKLKAAPDMLVCDALLDQDIFSGSGNIIKNEVLFRSRIHPLSVVGKLPPRKLTGLIKDARDYSFDFLEWKRAYVLKQHWQIYTKKECPRCHLPVTKEYMGTGNRRTFFCNNCQIIYE